MNQRTAKLLKKAASAGIKPRDAKRQWYKLTRDERTAERKKLKKRMA